MVELGGQVVQYMQQSWRELPRRLSDERRYLLAVLERLCYHSKLGELKSEQELEHLEVRQDVL